MTDPEKYNEDFLKKYLNHEMIEKAPEGFTSKVMAQISVEPLPVKEKRLLRKRNIVPIVSASVTIGLIIITFLIPDKESPLSLFVTQLRDNIKFSLPKIDVSQILNITFPAWLPYIFIGILLLSVLDIALSRFFNKEEQQP